MGNDNQENKKKARVAQITLANKEKRELKELKGTDDSFRLFEMFDVMEIDMTLLKELEEKHKEELAKISKMKNNGVKDKKTKEMQHQMAKDVAYKITNVVMRKSYKAKGLIGHLIKASFVMTDKEVADNTTPEFLTLAMTMIISKNYSAIVGFFMSNNS